MVRRFIGDVSGASAVEYGLLVALIALVIVGGVQVLGTNLQGKFSQMSDALK